MSYYEPQGWQAPARQSSWEQPAPPSRSGASSATQSREDGNAFASQFEEVDRVVDNLVKSGKILVAGGRRDIAPPSGRPYENHAMHGGGSQRHSMDFDPSRPHSTSNLQNFYASQRHQGRQTDAEHVMQAKRRMAAQRERDLRNYHQEQQYNRSVLAEMSSNKSDRSMSPSAMSEEGRRELLARQHRALYSNESNTFLPPGGFGDENAGSRESSSNLPASATGKRGNSPRGDPFGMGQAAGQQIAASSDNSASNQEAGRSDATSPAAGVAPTQFGNIDVSAQQSGNSKTSPAAGESPTRGLNKATTAPIGPIGSRLSQQQAPSQSISKRSTTPLISPMNNLGFSTSEQANNNERSGSSNSNPGNGPKESGSGMGTWGAGSGVWGSNKVGTPVWG